MNSLNLMFPRNPAFTKCKSCGTVGSLHRSRSRNFFEQLIKKVTFFKIYRCNNCGWRGFKSTYVFTSKSLQNLLYYLLIIVGSALIIWLVVSRTA